MPVTSQPDDFINHPARTWLLMGGESINRSASATLRSIGKPQLQL